MIEAVLPFLVVVWSIPGIVGGIVSALTIRSAEPRVSAASLVTIAVGWIAGMTIGGIAGDTVFLVFTANSLNDVASWIIGWGITGMVTALIGSSITYKVLEPWKISEE